MPAQLQPLVSRLGEVMDFGSAKIDELDRRLSGTLAEQSQRTEVQLAQLDDERARAAQDVVAALDDFAGAMDSQMAEELLRISEAELEYHKAMVSHLNSLVVSLRCSSTATATTTSHGSGGTNGSPPPGRTHASAAAAAAAAAAASSLPLPSVAAASFGSACSSSSSAFVKASAACAAACSAAVSAVGGGGGGSTSTLAPALLPSSGTPTTPTIEASLAPIELGEEDATWIDGPIDQTQAEPDSEEAGAEGHAEGASRRAAVTATMPVLAGGGEDDEIVD